MLGELDIAVFLKMDGDLETAAGRVFRALGSEVRRGDLQDRSVGAFEGSGLGFSAVLYENVGDMLDQEFEEYQYTLEVTSQFSCMEIDALDLEGALSEYYARLLAFSLDSETAIAIPVEETDDTEIFEVRAFARNNQYRMDQGVTATKVALIETRRFESPLDGGDWEDEGIEGDEV